MTKLETFLELIFIASSTIVACCIVGGIAMAGLGLLGFTFVTAPVMFGIVGIGFIAFAVMFGILIIGEVIG